MMASRLAQRQRNRPGFIHIPPPPMPPLQLASSRSSHAASLNQISHSQPESSDAGNNNIMLLHPSMNMDGLVDSPPAVGAAAAAAAAATPGDRDAVSPHIPESQTPINTAAPSGPVAIPPPPRISSPYYSPSQIFPASSTNKSYFPNYLSQSPQNQRGSTAPGSSRRPSPLGTPLGEQPQPPKTPRSPSFFTSGIPSASSPRSPLASIERPRSPFDKSMPPPASVTSSPLSNKARAATISAAARTYHSHLAQQQLAFQMQQRELIYQATRANTAMGPISPRLLPLGSPGPVTPLTLEDNPAGYLVVPGPGLLTTTQVLQLQQQHLEKLAAAAAAADKEAAEDGDLKPSQ